MATVLLLGTMDTKGIEYDWLRSHIVSQGVDVLLVDASIMGEPTIKTDIGAREIVAAAESNLDTLRKKGDRGEAVATMAQGAAVLLRKLHSEGRFDAMMGLGGSGGSSLLSAAMRALPIGVPKLMVSTLACGDTRSFIGGHDIMMMYPVVDIAGINSISEKVFANAGNAIAGMAKGVRATEPRESRPVIGASQFGVTTQCVNAARERLESLGYEVLVFHSAGTGGRSMEALIRDGLIDGVLDVTTSELADEMIGGIHNAGPDRLEAAGMRGIPQVVSLGALDMCDFGPKRTVPERFAKRKLYAHNPNVTLMRTTPEENRKLGRLISRKLNAAKGPVELFIPLGGVSSIDLPGKPFHDPEADQALFKELRETIDSNVVRVKEFGSDINDPAFGQAMADALHTLMGQH